MSAKNVLMICTDHLAYNRLGLYGGTAAMTPTMDFLARSGVLFRNAYSECPVCIPARRTLMTGLSPRAHGDRVYSAKMPMPGVKTLAQCFRDNGYQAYAVGKLHVYPQRDRIGFDDVILMEEGRNEFGVWDDYQIWLGEQGYISDEFLHGMGNNAYYTRPWPLPESAHPTAWATKEMAKIIRRKDPTRPAFFYISYITPHPPLLPLQEYLDMFDLNEIEEPIRDDDWSSDNVPVIKALREGASRYSEKEIRLAKRAYYATCTHIDHQIRVLIGTLRESGLLNDTVILLTSDHGDMLFDHGMAGKRLFYEGSTNVPLIFSGSPVLPHRDTDGGKLAALADVMPTLLSLCGLDVPDTVEGIDLFSESRHEMIFGEISEGKKATRMAHDGRFKLIYYPWGNVTQLFDLENDPAERHNLTGQPQVKDVQEKLEAFLIKNLHSGDEAWARDGKLVGYEKELPADGMDFGLHNQRGAHWPPTTNYSNR